MNHRYGRHGFNAWCRLREHRLKHSTHPLVSSACVTVIHVHVKFMQRERIFIVALDENGMQINHVNSMDIVNEYPTATLPGRQKPDPFEELKHYAKLDASKKVEEDLANLGEPSTEENLRAYARAQSWASVEKYVTVEAARGLSTTQLRDIYVEAFMVRYREYLVENIGNGDLPNEQTRRIKRKAREDKTQDLALGKQLSIRQISYQAAVRALETLHLNTNHPDYLAQIEIIADCYIGEYNDYKEVGRGQRDHSNMFPSQSYS